MANSSTAGVLWRRMGAALDWLGLRLKSVFSSKLFLVFAFIWFAAQAIYMAITVKFNLPPDETYHFEFIKLFSQHSPSPFLPTQGDFSRLTESVHNPFFLYHYLLSFPYLAVHNFSETAAFLILRLINVGFGVGSLFFVYKIASFIKLSPLMRNLTVFMFANTLMFVFLSAAINYDNLFNLLVLATIYLTLCLFRSFSALRFLLILVCMLAGVMVKINFLPIAFIVFLLLAFRYFSRSREVLSKMRLEYTKSRTVTALLSVLLVFLGFLFVQRYVFNMVSYGSYSPSCQKIRSLEDCRKNTLFVRDEYVHGAGRHKAPMSIVRYTIYWLHLMKDRVFGIFTSGNRIIATNKYMDAWIYLAALVYGVAIIRTASRENKYLLIFLGIATFYLLVLLYENYSTYKGTGRPSLAVQGRYILAVLPLFYLAGNHYIEKLLARRRPLVQGLFVLITVIIFAVSALPTYLHKSTPAWHQHYAKTSSQKIVLGI